MSEKDFAEKIEENITYLFKVKYNGTEANKKVHNDFKDYCLANTDNSYIMGIKKLLEIATTDWQYEALFDEIQFLKGEIDSLREELNNDNDKEVSKPFKTFGGEKNE